MRFFLQFPYFAIFGLAVFVDATLYSTNPAGWNQIRPRIGDELERLFVAEGGNNQILEFTDP